MGLSREFLVDVVQYWSFIGPVNEDSLVVWINDPDEGDSNFQQFVYLVVNVLLGIGR